MMSLSISQDDYHNVDETFVLIYEFTHFLIINGIAYYKGFLLLKCDVQLVNHSEPVPYENLVLKFRNIHRSGIPKRWWQEIFPAHPPMYTYSIHNILYTYLYKTSCFSQNSKTMPRTRKRIPLCGSIFVFICLMEVHIAASLSPLNGSCRQQDQFLQRRLL